MLSYKHLYLFSIIFSSNIVYGIGYVTEIVNKTNKTIKLEVFPIGRDYGTYPISINIQCRSLKDNHLVQSIFKPAEHRYVLLSPQTINTISGLVLPTLGNAESSLIEGPNESFQAKFNGINLTLFEAHLSGIAHPGFFLGLRQRRHLFEVVCCAGVESMLVLDRKSNIKRNLSRPSWVMPSPIAESVLVEDIGKNDCYSIEVTQLKKEINYGYSHTGKMRYLLPRSLEVKITKISTETA